MEVFIDQVKMASHIQLSKVENMTEEELNTIFEDIRKINQNAEIHTSRLSLTLKWGKRALDVKRIYAKQKVVWKRFGKPATFVFRRPCLYSALKPCFALPLFTLPHCRRINRHLRLRQGKQVFKLRLRLVVGMIQNLGFARAGENLQLRSEERRVGKECRSRWSPYH